MKRLAERLASMQFTAGILIVLMAWFAWGILLAESDSLRPGFNVMNSVLAPEWFSRPRRLPMVLGFWFVGLCGVMGVLGINLIFCSWMKIVRLMRNRQAAARMVMLIIHMVFGLVALGHFGSFMLGYRFENVHLRECQTFELPEGYVVTVKAIQGGENPVMYASPKETPAGVFNSKANCCQVALSRNGKDVAEGSAFFLQPFVYKDVQVTLKRFTLPKGKKGASISGSKPGVRLIISRNPVKMVVFVLFPVMIAGIGIYMVMTWRTRPADS
jgi:hypothetical protein